MMLNKGPRSLRQRTLTPEHIPIHLLVPHPENSNFMDEETLKKLRRHIERTGRYEPLTVRPHPQEVDKFQIINGHNRLRVLRALNYEAAQCIIWNLDDDQTRLCLATLNRLSGSDVPERRATLLENLLGSFDIDELAVLLPDETKQLEELRRQSRLELDENIERSTAEEKLTVPVILNFMLEESEAKEINLALDLLLRTERQKPSRSHALLRLARFYLGQCDSLLAEHRA